MKLSELIAINSEIDIQSIMVDSRKPSESSIFFCLKGLTTDGHQFITNAIKNGAVCIIHSKKVIKVDGILYYQVSDVFETYVNVSHRFYNNIRANMTLIGVTGTNGKTTIASITQSILSNFHPTGYIGTNDVKFDNVLLKSKFTTPLLHDTLDYLSQMSQQGVTLCAMETSSEGLHQKRTQGIQYDYAIFTNLSHDHLNYHKTFENYLRAKKILFDNLSEKSFAIVNVDDPHTFEITKDTKAKIITYGIDNLCDYQAQNILLGSDHTTFDLVTKNSKYHIKTNLLARFNVYNLLSVLAVLDLQQYDLNTIIPLLEVIELVEGRMNYYHVGDITVLVDYAHTPDGFSKLFEFAQTLKKGGRIISVFGSAGKRDKQKRPILGNIASQYSDVIVLTEEDNRNEAVHDISLDIKKGISDSTTVHLIDDRHSAIETSLTMAKANDIILILGKGSETFLDRETGRTDWISDTRLVELLVKNIEKR